MLRFKKTQKQLERAEAQLEQAQGEIRSLHISHRKRMARFKKEVDQVAASEEETKNAYHSLKRNFRLIEGESAMKDRKLAEMQQQNMVLTNRLQSTQFRPDNPLYDDEASKVMKCLQEKLNRWVTANFGKSPQLDALSAEPFLDDGCFSREISKPETFHERRSLVHAVVAHYMNYWVFCAFVLGAKCRSSELDEWTRSLGQDVYKQCPRDMFNTWLNLTSRAAGNTSTEPLNGMCDSLVAFIGEDLLQYSSRDQESGIKQLRQLVIECMTLKQQLERQGYVYFFQQSLAGTPYSAEKMQSLRDVQGEAIVKYSLWPGLWKHI